MSERLQVIKDVILVPGLGDQTDLVKATSDAAADRLAERGYTPHLFVSDWANRGESMVGKRRRLGTMIHEVADSSDGPVGLVGFSHGGNLALLAGGDNQEALGSVVTVHTRTRFTDQEEGAQAVVECPAGADSVDLVHQGWPKLSTVLNGIVATVRIPGADDRMRDVDMMLDGANNQGVRLLGRGDLPVRGHGTAIHTLLTTYRGARAVGTLVGNPKATIKSPR